MFNHERCSLSRIIREVQSDVNSWLIAKDPDAGKNWGQEEKGATEDKMIIWHHWLNGHETEQTLGDGEVQGSLECYSPWGGKESYMTEKLNNKKIKTITQYHLTLVRMAIIKKSTKK